ncbi:putative leader peptide [Streptomyces sp. DvalAA-14]|uniref:putative leader peptide n=1 Tax=Streptomyces sp. DvalAA-14 TaxID=1839759 RepID=UPI00351F5397
MHGMAAIPPALRLVGRAAEIRRLTELVDAGVHRGGSLPRGDAGMGKSALLAVAGEHASANGTRALSPVGVEREPARAAGTRAESASTALPLAPLPVGRRIAAPPCPGSRRPAGGALPRGPRVDYFGGVHGVRLVTRIHVDLLRSAGALCPRRRPSPRPAPLSR